MSIYVTYLQKLKVDKPEILFIDKIIEQWNLIHQNKKFEII